MNKVKNYINGLSVCDSNDFISVDDPSTGEKITEVVLSNENDLKNTIDSSEKGFENWSNYTPLKRSRVISKYKEYLEKDIDNLAKIVSIEHGKTIEDSKGSITRGLEVVEFACGIPHLVKGEFSQNV